MYYAAMIHVDRCIDVFVVECTTLKWGKIARGEGKKQQHMSGRKETYTVRAFNNRKGAKSAHAPD